MVAWFRRSRKSSCTIGYAASLSAMVAVLVACSTSGAEEQDLRVTNHQSGEVLRYPVVLLRGEVPVEESTAVEVVNESSNRDSRTYKTMSLAGRFKALAELVPGKNRVTVRSKDESIGLELTYEPQTNPYFVRMVYLTDASGDTDYQTPDGTTSKQYKERLDTIAKLMQTFTAERLSDLGYGRRTFNLEFDENGRVKIHTIKGQRPAEVYYAMPDMQWSGVVNQELRSIFPDELSKNVVIAAYTRWDGKTQTARGHTALGGGNQGLFGSANFFTWPATLQEVDRVFQDVTPMDTSKTMDDSAFRSTVWGAAATTMGATLHELGHTFDLPHTRDPFCIMSRGFDHFNRVFVMREPKSGRGPGGVVGATGLDEARFSPASAAWLRASEWFALDDPKVAELQPMQVRWAEEEKRWHFSAQTGLRALGVFVTDESVDLIDFWKDDTPAPRSWSISDSDLKKIVEDHPFRFRIADDNFQRMSVDPEEVRLAGKFVTSWHLSPRTNAWNDVSRFVSMPAGELEKIVADAVNEPMSTATSARFDLLRAFPNFPTQRAAYAVRRFDVPHGLKAKLLIGSDDAIRVWLDGKVVQEQLALRAAVPDSDQIELELSAGEHTLVAEISNGVGDWAFYLRLVDEEDRPLQIDSEGRLNKVKKQHVQ